MDVVKRLSAMRLTEEEERELLYALLEKVEPKPPEAPRLLSALETQEKAQEILAQGDRIVGLSSGYQSIDKMTKGFAPGDLVIVYGDTSHGKSQLTQNITYRIAKTGTPVMFIGLEMINPQNTSRFLQIGQKDPELEVALANIIYPEANDLRYETIEGYIESAVGEGAKLIVVDQLQQLTRSLANLTNETSLITHEIKRMAVKFQVPIILISHINRTGSKLSAPTLSELKGSSSIEQDADICLAVWRDTDIRNGNMDTVEVWQRKNRNRGGMGMHTELTVENGVGLKETNSILDAVTAVFPGVKMV